MGKIKHNQAISIFQMVLTFIQQILGLCKKQDGQSPYENENGGLED